jgi:hypothetical protein
MRAHDVVARPGLDTQRVAETTSFLCKLAKLAIDNPGLKLRWHTRVFMTRHVHHSRTMTAKQAALR